MQENRNVNSSPEVLEFSERKNTEVEEKQEVSKLEEAKEKKVLPKRSIEFEDGTIISNLKITYKNLFDFQNSYEGSKDLMEALIKKQTFDHETMLQLIYVAYLGTNPTPKLDYISFLEQITFDYKRDMSLFKDLTGIAAEKN